MLRSAIVLTLGLLMCALSSIPATAESAWDPDDVAGPLDVRWVGASFASPTELKIVVSFYDGFRVEALGRFTYSNRRVQVELQDYATGYFVRRPSGRIAFVWGDFASGCGAVFQYCNKGVVTRPSANVLQVTIVPSFDALPWNIHVKTFWHAPDGTGAVQADRASTLALGFPPEAA